MELCYIQNELKSKTSYGEADYVEQNGPKNELWPNIDLMKKLVPMIQA